MSLEHSQAKTGLRVLRRKATAEKLDVNPTTIWRWVNDPKYAHLNFPKPIYLGQGSVGFLEDEIDAWLLLRRRHSTVA